MTDSVAEQIAALRDEDWAVREDAATLLGHLGDPRGVKPLILALGDSDQAVRHAATEALTAIGEPAVVELGLCLQNPNLSVQEAAASVLVKISDDQVLDPLISALVSSDWIVRMYAARALARLRNPKSVETLILLLQDKVKAVRDEAAVTLKAMGDLAVTSLIHSLQDTEWRVRFRVAEALGVIQSPLAVDPLLNRLAHDSDRAVRQDAAKALGEIGDARAVTPLLEALENDHLRVVAIEALGKIGDQRAVGPLLEILKELRIADYEGRLSSCQDERYKDDLAPAEAAVKALARIGDPQTLPVLVAALQNTLIRAEAAEAISAFGQQAIPVLVDLLKSEKDENIQCHIKETLSRVGWKRGQIRL